MRGALLSIAAGGSMGLGSILRLSGFSFGALGVTSFSVVVGGTEAPGTTLSRCLFLPLSRAGGGIVADGTEAAARRISRVLTSDPGMGVIRHADAGYDEAVQVAKARGVKIPGITL